MKLISRELTTIGPSEAQYYASINTLEMQRAIRKTRRGMLVKKIQDGLFRFAIIGIARLDGREILVNGQGQSEAIIETGQTVAAVIEIYEVSDYEDLSLLFRQYDNNVSSRNLRELLAIEGFALGLNGRVNQDSVALTITALCMNDFALYGITADAKTDLLQAHIEECIFINSIIFNGNGTCKFLKRGPVAASMLRTWARNRKLAMHFWSTVRDGEDLKRTDPQMVLRDFLMSTTVNRGVGAQRATTVSAHEMIYRSMVAWNAYRRGDSLKILKYYPEKQIPLPK